MNSQYVNNRHANVKIGPYTKVSLSISHVRRNVIVTDINGISPESPISIEG